MHNQATRIVLVICSIALAVLCFTVIYDRDEHPPDLTAEEIASFRETRALILESYVKEVDPSQLIYWALKGMVEGLDGYSIFYDPGEECQYRENINGEHIGVGVRLKNGEPGIIVHYPFVGSPAEIAGLAPLDRLVAVDGESTDGKTVEEVQQMLKGAPGSNCDVVCDRPSTGERLSMRMRRCMVIQPSVFGERIMDADGGVGYLRVTGFNKGTCQEVVAAVDALMKEGARRLIMDLRFNPGGLLEAALETANLFIGEGVLLRTRGRSLQFSHVYEASPARLRFPDIPLVVLVNEYTASAGEVLAGTLQDHKRAVIGGARTFGKGVVQSAFPRKFGGRDVVVKLTTARYYTPLGRCIDRELGNGTDSRGGIEPDVGLSLEPPESQQLKAYFAQRNVPTRYLQACLGAAWNEPRKDEQLAGAVRILRQ